MAIAIPYLFLAGAEERKKHARGESRAVAMFVFSLAKRWCLATEQTRAEKVACDLRGLVQSSSAVRISPKCDLFSLAIFPCISCLSVL